MQRVRERAYAWFLALCETDFTQTKPFAILSALFFLVRVPWIPFGYGTDPDAWRVAITAQHLLDTGEYYPSRLPGNPLHELVMTVLVPGGWWATDIATAIASLVGVWLFVRILRELDLPNRGLLVTGFAFAPLLVINSIATMDYMWTLTLILGCYYLVLRGYALPAGLLLGAAIGFRLQSAIVLLPMLYILWRARRYPEMAPFVLATGGAAMLAFAPVLVVYGPKFLNYYDASIGLEDVLRLLGKEALGVAGAFGVLIGAALSWKRLRSLLPDLRADTQVAVWVAVIVLYFATFSRLPHEVAYLIPVFPFGMLLIGRYYTRAAVGVAIGAILLAGVVDITTPSDEINADALSGATIGKGLVLSNAQTMDDQRDDVNEYLENNDLPDHSLVLAGFLFPQLVVRSMDDTEAGVIRYDYDAISMLSDRGVAIDRERDIQYVWLLEYDTLQALRAQGYKVFTARDAGGSTGALYDYRPALLGAAFLSSDSAGTLVAGGTAGTDR
jgi:hypothetical protein